MGIRSGWIDGVRVCGMRGNRRDVGNMLEQSRVVRKGSGLGLIHLFIRGISRQMGKVADESNSRNTNLACYNLSDV